MKFTIKQQLATLLVDFSLNYVILLKTREALDANFYSVSIINLNNYINQKINAQITKSHGLAFTKALDDVNPIKFQFVLGAR